MIFYHLDRTSSLIEGKVLKNYNLNSVTNYLEDHADFLFPKGFSSHGRTYLLNSNSPDAKIEWFYEYVRRSHFNSKPSRFTSFFAVDCLDEIDDIFGETYGDVYKIEAEHSFRADMNLLKSPDNFLDMSIYAHKYWTGELYEDFYRLNTNEKIKWEYLLYGEIKVKEKVKEFKPLK
ncbi:hypothetical protein [Cytobacillus sp. FSL K6-0265]|uniref:hypothetical protein n=1 Tax=Cytobacillus sp. FSL K6-0265 TaxID=2921448 RepID=UPI0030F9E671